MKIMLLIIFHIIGAAVMIFIQCKNENMEYSSKYGDGIRTCKPSDIIAISLIMWEMVLFVAFIELIDDKINQYFERKFKK